MTDKIDYISHGNSQELSDLLETITGINRTIDRLTSERDQALDLATKDSLTGLLNRSGLVERLTEEVSRAYRHSRNILVVSLDLVGFKAVNDVYNHEEGNYVLQTIAERLKSKAIRLGDFVARPGGDEFYVVLTEIRSDEQSITTVLKKIYSSIIEAMPHSANPDVNHNINARIGAYLFTPDEKQITRAYAEEKAKELILRADENERELHSKRQTGIRTTFYKKLEN